MNIKTILLACAMMCGSVMQAGTPAADASSYALALRLYGEGNYSSARIIFENCSRDPLCEAYAVLCAARLRDPSFPELYASYRERRAATFLDSELHYRYGLILFDEGRYARAAAEFAQVRESRIDASEITPMRFRVAYCKYEMRDFEGASKMFSDIAELPYSTYTGASCYYVAYMAYLQDRHKDAAPWFERAAEDDRFSALSSFYLVECHFLDKDYDYVLDKGLAIVDSLTPDRSAHISRMLSDAYLVKGDASKAKEFYDRENSTEREMTRADWFHAGCVMYDVGDYAAAIDAFTKMGDLSDSLGQVASYQLGYAYVKKGNKVSALSAFNDAASRTWSEKITEDAAFNYAKLSFDINHDVQGFKAYLAAYSTREKGEQIYNYIAIAELYNKQYEAAIEAYDNLEVLNSEQRGNYARANYLRARELVNSGSWSRSKPFLKAAGFYYPRNNALNQLSRYWLAEADYHTSDYLESAGGFADLYNTLALPGSPESAMLPYNAAYSYYLAKDFKAASRWFDTYIGSGDKTALKDAMEMRADCDFQQTDYEAAVESYRRLGEAFSDNDYIYPVYREGLCLGLVGKTADKITVLSRVRTMSRDAKWYQESIYELGRACLDKKKPADAIEAFTLLRDTASDTAFVARARIGLGMAWRNRKKYDKALAEYKSVVSMLPGSEYANDALLAIESIYQATGHPEKYLKYVESESLMTGKSGEEKAQIYFNTAEQVYLAGNFAQAISSLEKYLADNPSGAETGKATFYMADSYRSLQNWEKALEWYAKVPGLIPGTSFSEISMLKAAETAYRLEKFAESYGWYTSLDSTSALQGNRDIAKAGRMRAAYKCKDYENAITCARTVEALKGSDAALKREASYIRAKSLLSLSRRDEAMKLFTKLSSQASVAEGAEASYILIQATYDSGDFAAVEQKVYDFAAVCGSQSYWLAKSYIVLGDSFIERGNLQQGKVTFESVRDGYVPSGESDDVMENINFRLEKLKELMK